MESAGSKAPESRCRRSSKLAPCLDREAATITLVSSTTRIRNRNAEASARAYIRKLKVCQRSRRSHWPTVRLPTLIRAVPRMPGVKVPSGSSSVISTS